MRSYQSIELALFEDNELDGIFSYTVEKIYLPNVDKLFICHLDNDTYKVEGDFAYVNLN
jgi:hypothetical protein